MPFVVYELGEPHPWPESPARATHKTEPPQPAGRLGPGPGRPDLRAPRRKMALLRSAQKAYGKVRGKPTQMEEALTADQIMSAPVITLSWAATMDEAWRLFRERRFRHVPVLSEDGKLMGIVSDRELLHAAARIGSLTRDHSAETVGDLVDARVLTAHPETPIREIARTLFEEHIGAMPIVDGQGNLAGIITRSDILRALINHAPLQLWV